MDLDHKSKIMKTKIAEDIVLTRKGNWVFDEHVSIIFDAHVRKSIPCYETIQKLITQISKKVLLDNALVYDLGTATGEVIYNIFQANATKNISFVGIDESLPMINEARKKCETIKNSAFYNANIETYKYDLADLIVAAFTLQFTPILNRKKTLENIKNALKPNGIFIFCEKIIYPDSKTNKFFKEIYEEWKRNYFSKKEIKSKRKSLKHVMQPLSLSKNIELLKEAGFKEINVFFQWCNFVGIIAK